MALDHGDLFFINRSGATYKIEAVELGDYLTNNQLPAGGYIVNDGIFAIANTGNPNLVDNIFLHSANTPNDSVLDFDKHFVVQSRGNDATVTINFMELKDSFLCNGGVGSGFDINNCDCLQLDFDEIGNRLPCPDGGIVNDMGCLEVNLCQGGLITLGGTNNGAPCLGVNICSGQGLEQVGGNGCLQVDMDYIRDNIVCGGTSGLNNDGTCLSVNFDDVMANMSLGKLDSDGTVKFIGGGNRDLREGNVKLSVDWSQNPDTNGCEGDILYITQGGARKGLYNPCLGREQTIALDAGGSGGGGVTKIVAGTNINITPGGGTGVVTINSTATGGGSMTCQQVNDCFVAEPVDKDKCAQFGRLRVDTLQIASSGTEQAPGLLIGGGADGYCGISTGVNSRRMRLLGGSGWSADSCGGGPAADPDIGSRSNLFTASGGPIPGNGPGSDGNIAANPSRFMQCPTVAREGGADALFINVNNMVGRQTKRSVDLHDAVTEYDDTSLATSNVETILDSLVGTSNNSKFTCPGIFSWGKVKQSEVDDLRVFDPADHDPRIVCDFQSLHAVHPYLVNTHYSINAFEDESYYDKTITDTSDPRYWDGQVLLKADPADREREVIGPNNDALILTSLLLHKARKNQVVELQNKVSTLETTLATMEARLAALEAS